MDILDDEVMDRRMSQHFHASQKEPREGEPADTPITAAYQESAGTAGIGSWRTEWMNCEIHY